MIFEGSKETPEFEVHSYFAFCTVSNENVVELCSDGRVLLLNFYILHHDDNRLSITITLVIYINLMHFLTQIIQIRFINLTSA